MPFNMFNLKTFCNPRFFIVNNCKNNKHIQQLRFYPTIDFSKACSSNSVTIENKLYLVAFRDVKRFIEGCMIKVGTQPKHAQELADVLFAADYRGYFNHGLNNLETFVADVERNPSTRNHKPNIIHETNATAFVDGNNVLGPTVGNYCMNLAIEKAKRVGIGWVVTKGSNYYSIAGYYSAQAMKKGLLGMAFTNTSPLISTKETKKSVLGLNPISVAAPGKDGDGYVLDMATSTLTLEKIVASEKKGKFNPIPWGTPEYREDVDHLEQVNPIPWGKVKKYKLKLKKHEEILQSQENLVEQISAEKKNEDHNVYSDYRGFGLSLLVETICAVLGDANYTKNIKTQSDGAKSHQFANLGQCFVAINPGAFAPGFENRMQHLINICRNLHKEEGIDIMVPGDPERLHMEKCDKLGGILYRENIILKMEDLAKRLAVKQLQYSNN